MHIVQDGYSYYKFLLRLGCFFVNRIYIGATCDTGDILIKARIRICKKGKLKRNVKFERLIIAVLSAQQ